MGVGYHGTMWRAPQPCPGERDVTTLSDFVRVSSPSVVSQSRRHIYADLPRTVTPITVSHEFIIELFFSLHGETDEGERMAVPGPGGLRLMRSSRSVILPSVRVSICARVEG